MENKTKLPHQVKYHPLAIFIMLSLSGVTQAASINAKNVTSSVTNGVTVIDINKANDQGISHNIYDQLDVDKNGLIFNNSQNAIKTTLAGNIKGNSNLTSGAAKVILNEVTSKNQSALQGWVEVAGSKAHLIIANPNGISCQGCGFINAEKVTVTTGKPDMQNGALKGYSVNRGLVTLTKMQSASPTEILARSVIVNGRVDADELTVIAGNNYIDVNGEITNTAEASGKRSVYGIDVAALGGMYANKISMISNEKGIGVRNNGTIAGKANIKIESNGKLINNQGKINSDGLVSIKTKSNIDNLSGGINTNDTLYIDSNKSAINNSLAGSIAAKNAVYIDSGSFNNVNGKVSAGGTLALNTHNQTLTNSGKGNASGLHAAVVALQTGVLDNQNGVIKGHYVGIAGKNINNSSGIMESTGDTDITSAGNIENHQGLIRSTAGHVHIDVNKSTLNNGNTKTADTFSGDSQGIIAGEGGIQIHAASLNNRAGQIASKGAISFISSGGVDNFTGKLLGDKTIDIKAESLMNGQAGISSREGMRIELTKDFTNSIGIVNSDEGNIELQARFVNNKGGLLVGQDVTINALSAIDNSVALMVANKNLIVNAPGLVNNSHGKNFGKDYGYYLAMPNQQGGMIGRESVNISANSVNNENSRIVAEFGQLNITAKDKINNAYSRIVATAGESYLKAQSVNNDYAVITSNGSMTINSGTLSNLSSGSLINNDATGIIAAGENLIINAGSTFTNYGWISSQGNAMVKVEGIFSNRNTVNAEKNLAVTAANMIVNYKNMVASSELTLDSGTDIKNNFGGNITAETLSLAAKDELTNDGNIVSNNKLVINTASNIYNYSNMFTYGSATINSKGVANIGNAALLGGAAGMELKTGLIANSGFLLGL